MATLDQITRVHPLNTGGIFSASEITYLASKQMLAPTNGVVAFGYTGGNFGAAANNLFPRLPFTFSSSPFSKMSAGSNASVSTPMVLAIDQAGGLYSAGISSFGSLGRVVTTAAPATALAKVTDTAGVNTWRVARPGDYCGAGVQTDGTLWTWGYGNNYRTGQGSTGNLSAPTKVGTATDWSDCWMIGDVGFATKTNGSLWSWGANTAFLTGQASSSGTTNAPTQVGSSLDWLNCKVSGRNGSTGAVVLLKSNGSVWAVGAQTNYRFGNNTNSGSLNAITQVASPGNWTDICFAQTGTFLLRNDGKVYHAGAQSTFSIPGGSYNTTFQLYHDETIVTSLDVMLISASAALLTMVDNAGGLWMAGLGRETPAYLPGVLPDTDLAEVAKRAVGVVPIGTQVTANFGMTFLFN